MRRKIPSNELRPGETVRHFEIVGPLGSGGMGVVYRARDRKLDREVALKFLPPHIACGGEESERFLREARVASALDHPNICTVHAIEETADGRAFIAMAAYDGETLRDRLVRGPLPLGEWLEIAQQICRGLSAAHGSGIVHRDIKPANVMLTEQGLVKILDFGLSKSAGAKSERSRLTRSGTILGTLAYISPEQALGEEVGPPSDLWSLGAMLYEMATGHLPFDDAHDLSNLFQILHKEPAPPSSHLEGMPDLQERIILRALSKDLAERYGEVEELVCDLEQLAVEELGIEPVKRTELRNEARAPVTRQGGVSDKIDPTGATRRLDDDLPDTFPDTSPGTFPATVTAAPLSSSSGPSSAQIRGALKAGIEVAGKAGSGSAKSDSEASELAVSGASAPKARVRSALWGAAALLILLLPVLWLVLRPQDEEPSLQPEARLRLTEARAELRRHDGQAALKALEEVRTERTSAEIELARSRAHFLLGHEKEARGHAAAAAEAAMSFDAEEQGLYQAHVARLRGDLEKATARLEDHWRGRESRGAWEEGLRLDRGLDLVLLKARTGHTGAAFELLIDLQRAAPLDPRLPLLEAAIAPGENDRLAAARLASALAESSAAPMIGARARYLEGRALRRIGHADQAAEALEAAISLYQSLGLRAGQADALTTLGNLAWDRGELSRARGHYEKAAQLYGAVGNSRMRTRPLTNMALVLRELGDLEAAIAIFKQASDLQQELGDKHGRVFTLVNLSGSLQLRGRFTEAVAVAEEAAQLVEGVEDRAAKTLVFEVTGEMHTLTGQLHAAGAELIAMRTLAEESGELFALAQADFRLGRLRLLEADLGAAREHLAQALSRFEESGDVLGTRLVLQALAEALLLGGDLAGCRSTLEKARQFRQQEAEETPPGLRLRFAELLLAEGRTEEAVTLARRAASEIAPSRQTLDAASAQEVLARAQLAVGDLDSAASSLDAALSLLDGLNVPTYALPTTLTAARAAALGGRFDQAHELLQGVLAKSTFHGYKAFELEARLILGRLEMRSDSGPAGRQRLEEVAGEAGDLGLGRLSSEAEAALAGSSSWSG